MAYQFVETETMDESGLAWVRLNRPPVNALTIEVIEELEAAHLELAERKATQAVMLGSKTPKFFCNGMDPEHILAGAADERAEVFRRFFGMIRTLYGLPVLHIAAIAGHAMAGGAVLALACDYRIMPQDAKARIAFSEVAVGLTIPPFLLDMLAAVVGTRPLRSLAQQAAPCLPEEALEIGLVDQILPAAELEAAAEDYAVRMLALPQRSLLDVKRNLRAPVLAKLEAAAADPELGGFRPFLTGDVEEGLRAVQERRPPKFGRT